VDLEQVAPLAADLTQDDFRQPLIFQMKAGHSFQAVAEISLNKKKQNRTEMEFLSAILVEVSTHKLESFQT
jgi:hypothetical protein